MHFNVAGVTFDCRKGDIARLRVGDKLALVPEPHNIYDPHAIGIRTEWAASVGYVPRGLTSWVRKNDKWGVTVLDVDADFPYLKVQIEDS